MGNDMIAYMAEHLSKSDIYAAQAIATISAEIFKYRKKLGLSQKAFAKEMGVSQGMVSKWESADYNFTIETVAAIAEKLHVTLEVSFRQEPSAQIDFSRNFYDMQKIKTKLNKGTNLAVAA